MVHLTSKRWCPTCKDLRACWQLADAERFQGYDGVPDHLRDVYKKGGIPPIEYTIYFGCTQCRQVFRMTWETCDFVELDSPGLRRFMNDDQNPRPDAERAVAT